MTLRGSVKAAVRSRVRGSLWDHAGVRAALPLADVADRYARRRKGLEDLPPFSLRVRSNGFEGQFGGAAFARLGGVIADDLENYAGLTARSRVLDIGCGVGRVALALARRYPHLDYTGIDVDRPSIDGCRANPALRQFSFQRIDVANNLYNAGGAEAAASYRLPFSDGSFDVVYVVSVFTHMFPDACRNYSKEILRVLRPGGACAVTAILLEGTEPGWGVVDGAHCRFPLTPLKMVGHSIAQISGFFDRAPETVVRGGWHGGASDHEFSQDLLIFRA